jgi:cytochrome c biogenesis protein CcdA
MDSLTIIDIICMLVNKEGPNPQANLDVLRSLYERTHARFMGVVIIFGVLTACVLGVFVASVLEWGETKISILAVVALILMLASLGVLARRLNKVTRDYLDIIKVYNLLRRHVEAMDSAEASELSMR